MAEALVSGSWYRVAPLTPSLVAGLKVVRHHVRDQVWHILVEPGSGRQLRLNPAAYAFAGRCNGDVTVAGLWQLLLEKHAPRARPHGKRLSVLPSERRCRSSATPARRPSEVERPPRFNTSDARD